MKPAPIRDTVVTILELLDVIPTHQWAEQYIKFRSSFWRTYCLNLIFSTIHGAYFFENVLECLDGKAWEPDNTGEYEENFRKFIKHYAK